MIKKDQYQAKCEKLTKLCQNVMFINRNMQLNPGKIYVNDRKIWYSMSDKSLFFN